LIVSIHFFIAFSRGIADTTSGAFVLFYHLERVPAVTLRPIKVQSLCLHIASWVFVVCHCNH
jgi:hypothetical protein